MVAKWCVIGLMKAPIKPVAAVLVATILPAGAGVVADSPVGTESAAMPVFRNKFGVEVAYYHQEQPYELSGVPQLSLPPALPGGFVISNAALTNIENEIDHAHIKFDYDVLPFLNLFALAGWVDGQTSLNASGTLTQATLPPTVIPISLPFQIDYDGFVYGIGTTLSYGGENWFTSLTALYTRTDVDVRNSDIDAFAIMPRVGYKWNALTVWIGAMYLETDEEHQGIYNVNLGPPIGAVPVSYSLNLQQEEEINFLIGLNYEFSENWNATLEAGLGDRESIQVGVQARF
jgi:hypothetical protein